MFMIFWLWFLAKRDSEDYFLDSECYLLNLSAA